MQYSKILNVLPACDVLVCGAGASGITAAVTAARQGCSVVLAERYGVVGDMLTMGNVTTVLGHVASGTIVDELLDILHVQPGGYAMDPEYAKTALIRYITRENIMLYLQTPVIDVITENNAVQGVVLLTPHGPMYQPARVTIDATGDGYAAYCAGCEVMLGRDGDGLVQPVSLMYHIEGVQSETLIACRHEEDDTILSNGMRYLRLCEQAATDGRLPQNVTIVRLYPGEGAGEYLVNAAQTNGIDPLNMNEVTLAEADLREQIEQINVFLRENVPGYESIRTRISASTLGIRESRRIKGHYVLKDEDVMEGRNFTDVVVHQAHFPIDIHNPTGGGQAEKEGCPQSTKPYDIPMQCLQPLGVEGLIVCGRAISGTHRAHASYRVMGICMAMGQAAGVMAACALSRGGLVSEIKYSDVQERLERSGSRLRD